MTRRLYWLGNAAKAHVIDEILQDNRGTEPVTVFDYGCGDGGDWPAILAEHPQLRLVGYEPYAPSCRKARERLRGLPAEILTGADIDVLMLSADYIVSFSVFEHVVDRGKFLRHAKRLLAPQGVFYLNYDDGHFRNFLDVSDPVTWIPALRAWARTIISQPFASVGMQSHYQRRVTADEADAVVIASGFCIERIDYHNLASLKDLAKAIPEELQQRYAAWWLEAEELLNTHFQVELPQKRYGDSSNLWRQMLSRTLCLRHA